MHKIFTMRNLSYYLAIFIFLLYSCGDDDENKRPFGTLIEVPSEVETIKDAVKIAQPFDTILLQAKEYFEWNIEINKPIFITSQFLFENDSNLISQTIINANDESRVFTIDGVTDTLRLNGFTIKNGHAKLTDPQLPEPKFTSYNGAGIYSSNSNIKLTNLIIVENSASEPNSRGDGGGLYIDNSNILLDNVQIQNNYGLRTGGAFYCENSNLKIFNSLIENNRSSWGGSPITIWFSTVDFKNVIFRDNENAFDMEIRPELNIYDCTGVFENVYAINDSVLIENCTIELINCNIPGY